METSINMLTPGVKISHDTADIVLWAPFAKVAAIVIKDKETLMLHQRERGYWALTTDKLLVGDQYKFRLDNGKELPDPASKYQPEGVHGWSEVVDLNAHKPHDDDSWQNIPLAEYIIYELHTAAFTTDGTFKGIAQKLSYLKELGITAIEIMPVAQFPGTRNWGYDGVFPYAVQNSYGGYKGLMQLVDACHKQGVAVILDVVYNHVGPEGNYFNEFGPYFTSKYNTPWGNAVNFDDAGSDEVRKYFIENVLMWFRDFGIDALRLDAVHAIKDFSPKHILQEMREAVDELMAKTGKKHYLIIEFDLNDKRFIDGIENNGYGMDAQWIDEFHHALRVTAGGQRDGYYADFDGIEHLAKAYQDAYVYDGLYSYERQKTFGVKTNNPGEQFVVFSQNHDHVGNRMLGERTSILFSTSMQKLIYAAVMVSPYLPMLFMGEEYGELNPFLYFVSHSDDELITAVREGRKNEFKAFHSDNEAPDPQAEQTFLSSRLNWSSLDQREHQAMLAYYQLLIALRKNTPALNNNDRNKLEISFHKENQTIQLHRWEGEQHVYCYLNFSQTKQPFELPANERLNVIFRSEEKTDNRDNMLQPESIIIYANCYV
ncbi:malto-oligosyltrehalose trehalohydrolase [Mucilaginibacter sp. MD40]|uniref:malto-oligosyltrehalose trehalohydrolase n=1 Tax=Mucilaginibacter sp. MD40 TaxID=2029590 RepID=UPI000BACE34C|nr:malto-oligosyltrehalose trehalohydrolase [Mucilaginibacter sp. MD40]PAW94154.1 malto-oligosyltrehalose trehalohydrolase [Mucilaginibacter sp. MD40]